jgi:hypothetical protein
MKIAISAHRDQFRSNDAPVSKFEFQPKIDRKINLPDPSAADFPDSESGVTSAETSD